MANNTDSGKVKMTGEEFFEKNQKVIGIAMLAIIVVVGGIFLMRYMKTNKNADAQADIFQAQYYFEQDSLDLALNGDGRSLGFLNIIDIYGNTEAANLSNFYAGAIFLKQRDYASAVSHLEKFSTSEDIVQARAYSLIGDAYMEQGNFSNAAAQYGKAANATDDKYFSPSYLMKQSLAHEKMTDYSAAIASLEEIIENYFGATEYNEAKKHKARLEGLASR